MTHIPNFDPLSVESQKWEYVSDRSALKIFLEGIAVYYQYVAQELLQPKLGCTIRIRGIRQVARIRIRIPYS